MANILSHNMQRAMGLNGYQMLRQYNYTVFSSNAPERIILEAQSIVKQLIRNPRLEHEFQASKSIGLDGGYYIIWPHHKAAARKFEVPEEVMAYIRRYAESQDRGNHKVLLVVSTNTEFMNITRSDVRKRVDGIVTNDTGIAEESSPKGSEDEIG